VPTREFDASAGRKRRELLRTKVNAATKHSGQYLAHFMRQGAKVTGKFKSSVVAIRESHVTAFAFLFTMTSIADVSSIMGEYMLKGWVFAYFFMFFLSLYSVVQ
jgi:hypothetical protein